MTEKDNHTHIGTGKLGLGFVGYFSKRLDFSTFFVNRQSLSNNSIKRNDKLSEQKRYVIKYYDKDSSEEITFKNFYIFDFENNSEERKTVIKTISDVNTFLLTTAVGESQLSGVAPLLADGLQKRGKTGHPLFIIACENGRKCSSQLKQTHVIKNLSAHDGIFVDCVVDQVCDDIIIPKRKEDLPDCVTVSAESHRDWFIGSEDARLKDRLSTSALPIHFVAPNDIDLYEIRKLWLVNGFHLALAILGITHLNPQVKKTYLREVLEFEDLRETIIGLKEELVQALIEHMRKGRKSIFKPEDVESYINEIEKRFRVSPDYCERILRESLFDSDRIKQIAGQFAHDLQTNSLLKIIPNHLSDSIFNFFCKVRDRLYDPMMTNLNKKPTHNPVRYLNLVLLQLIFFLATQRDKVRELAQST